MCVCIYTHIYTLCVFGKAVQPSAGNMVYDEFVDDGDMFSELEMRLSHLQPVEVLYPSNCSERLKQALLDWTKYNGRYMCAN